MRGEMKNGCVWCACIEEQKNVIKDHLEGCLYNTKEKILAYYDNAHFFAVNVKQSTYKDLVGFLNRQANRGVLIKTSRGRGAYAAYVFPSDILEGMVDEILNEKTRGQQ